MRLKSIFFVLLLLSGYFLMQVPFGKGQPVPSSVRPEMLQSYKKRPITDDVIYFVLPDRFNNGDPANDTGGIKGTREDHGYDPTHKGFYHGGDFQGLVQKLDYLADMGISAVWMTPVFKNKTVQGEGVLMSAAYHGYWITDFTRIDPHLGVNEDLKVLVAEAHKRNMKVFFDIIVNHTADVIKYRECPTKALKETPDVWPHCDYRGLEAYPYGTRGSAQGEVINAGFKGDTPENQTDGNFAALTDPAYAYSPYIPKGEEAVKSPAWLNNISYYHNRGDTDWEGESALYGDFSGLDDIFTEHPFVQKKMIELYQFWISEFKIDGFRIDTVKHVNDSFWQAFIPAITKHAKAEGIENFYIFGEVYDFSPEALSHYTRVARLPAVLDFGFQSVATLYSTGQRKSSVMKDFYDKDILYKTDEADASILPTFLGNHDMGRIGTFIHQSNPEMSDDEAYKRMVLANALMYFTRGIPVVYYGDEQGFVSDGHDMDAREDMFASKVQSYNDNHLMGTTDSVADDNFNADHPLYKSLIEFARLRQSFSALRGGKQKVISASDQSGLLAILRESRMSDGENDTDTDTDTEKLLLVFNASDVAETATITLPQNNQEYFCFVAGNEGKIERKKHSLNYKAPALSWAVYSTKECQK